MRFSIITVVWNDVVGLQRTYDSIAAQKLSTSQFEWVVVDGASQDGSQSFCSNIQSDFQVVWVSEKDGGIYDAMNKGIALASGDYILFLNAGDELIDGDSLIAADRVMTEHDLYFFSAEVAGHSRRMLRPARSVDYLWHGLPASHQAIFFERKVALSKKYDLKYRICGDYYLVSKIVADGGSSASFSTMLSRFYLGGVSSKIFSPLIYEPYVIQRDILGVPFLRRVLSINVRFIKNLLLNFIR